MIEQKKTHCIKYCKAPGRCYQMDPKERCASKIDCVYARHVGKPVNQFREIKSIKDVLEYKPNLKKLLDGILGAE